MAEHRKKFIDSLLDHIDAACSGLYVDTTEINQVLDDVVEAAKAHNSAVWRWRVTKGLEPVNLLATAHSAKSTMNTEGMPFADCLSTFIEVKSLCEATEVAAQVESQRERGVVDIVEPVVSIPHILVVENFNWNLSEPFAVQTLIDAIWEYRQAQCTVLLVGTNLKIPEQLQGILHKLDRDLPGIDAVEEIARRVVQGAVGIGQGKTDQERFDSLIPPETRRDVFRAARGMTETEIEDAFSLSFACSDGEITSSMIGEYKKKFLEKSSALEIFSTTGGFDTLGGLSSLKEFLLDSLVNRANKDLFPLGVLLAGPPGTAKTEIARRLGTEVKVPVVALSVGKLLDKYVGGSEAQTANALKTVEAMSPCILVIDEMEKALAGSTGRGTSSDGGTMSRTLGTLLTWLSTKTHEIYVVATCNDLSVLPPELTRAGRFDAIFFLDLPTREQKDVIWDIYMKKYSVPDGTVRPFDEGWTGAEIEQCCRMASLQGKSLVVSSNYIVPVTRSSGSKIEQVREKAHLSLIDANYRGLYDKERYSKLREQEKAKTGNETTTRVVRTRKKATTK